MREEVTAWQARPLDSLYPLIYLDALHVKIRDGAHVRTKAMYLVIGINLQGVKEVLGLWIEQTEGATCWLQILTELPHGALDNVFVERLWRSVKYEEVYLKDYRHVPEAISGLGGYFRFYNDERLHQSLDYRTPAAVYRQGFNPAAQTTLN